METNEKVYCSQQLCCMLPPLAFKVAFYLIGWNKPEIKYYEKQMCKFLHLDKEELQLAIQTLEDNKIIDVSLVDQTWIISINKDTIKKYFNVKMETIAEHNGLQLAKVITWNKEETTSSNNIEDMSEDDMKRMLLMLQARLNERQQVKKVVVSTSKNETENVIDNLPF